MNRSPRAVPDSSSPAPEGLQFAVPCRVARRSRWRTFLTEDRGAVTAEYAIVILAAVAFAGLLVAIMRSSEIRAMLVQLVENALGAAG